MRRVVTDGTTSAGLRSGQASGVCSMDEHDTKTEDAPQAKNVSSWRTDADNLICLMIIRSPANDANKK